MRSGGWLSPDLSRLSNCWSSLSLSLSLSLGQFWPVRFLLLLLPATHRSRPRQIESQKSKICFSNFFCRLVITDTRWSVLPKTPDSSECKDQSLAVSHFYRPLQANSQHQCQSSLTRETGNRSVFLILQTLHRQGITPSLRVWFRYQQAEWWL